MEIQTLLNSRGQGHLLCHLCAFSQHLNDIFSETAGTISIKFHMQLPGKGGEKVYVFWSWSHDQDGRHAHIW